MNRGLTTMKTRGGLGLDNLVNQVVISIPSLSTLFFLDISLLFCDSFI